MALEMNTIGVKIGYAVETTAGTRPTTGYINIPDIKDIPEMQLNPSQLEVTNLVDQFKRYIPGLKDVGGDVPLTFNLTQALITAWAALVQAADTGSDDGKSTWFEVVVQKLNESFYFKGVPSPLGLDEIATDSAIEITGHVTPNEIVGWAAKST
jgi:hypothetical protein